MHHVFGTLEPSALYLEFSIPIYFYRHGEGYRGLIRKYKGCTGAIKGLYHVPGTQYFGAVGLDRHLRIYTIKGNHSFELYSSKEDFFTSE